MKFVQSRETLEIIADLVFKKTTGGYLRFGDGDINLANDESELLQTANKKLGEEMRQAMCLTSKTVLKTLPLYCEKYGGLEKGMSPGNHESPEDWCDNILARANSIWGEQDTLYATSALSHIASQEPQVAIDFFKRIRSYPDYIIVVGNKNIPAEVAKTIFGKHLFISTPDKGSYSEIDLTETYLNQVIRNYKHKYGLIVFSMGCSGRVLAKRVLNNHTNIFTFDFGSLMDMLCGWNTRAWMDIVKFDRNAFLTSLA
jgi:hypothetical protein